MTYILLLCIIPIIFSCLFLLKSSERFYKVLSGAFFLLASILSILLVFQGEQRIIISGETYHLIEAIVLVCEVFITLYMFYISIKHKRWHVSGLAIILTGLSIYSIFFIEGSSFLAINVDKLSLIMSLIVNIIGSLILMFSSGYMKHYEEHMKIKPKQKLYYFILCIFLSAMNGLIYSDSLSLMYFFWEVTTISSFVLISYNGNEEAKKYGFKALTLNLIGGVSFSLGNILLSKMMNIDTLSGLISNGRVSSIYIIPVFLLCIAGFAKSAQMPFQSWLLGAMVAPTPVSALLHSSTMVKAGVFLIIKLSPAYSETFLGLAIAIYGGISFFLCSAIAITQRNAKRVLAYSTIANLGLIILSAGIGSSLSISAAIMLLIFHAISKALLFLCAGQIEHIIGSRDIEDMTGLIRKAPVITIILVLGILSMILPPFGVLITKWVSMEAAADNPIAIALLVLGSALTSVYYIKWLGTVLSYPVNDLKPEKKIKFVTYFPLFSLGAGILATSIFITPIFNFFVSPEVAGLINAENQLSGSYIKVYSDVGSFNDGLVFLVLLATLVVYLFIRKFILSTSIKTVYLCGENSITEGSKLRFRTGDGTAAKPVVSNLYLQNIINENSVTYAGYFASIAIILVVIAGGLL